MIDWARILELHREIGPDDFSEVVEIFLEEVESEINELRSGCDLTQMESKFHMLKGSALNLGFRDFAEHCQVGEKVAGLNQHSQIDMQAVLAVYDMSKSEFLAGLNQHIK